MTKKVFRTKQEAFKERGYFQFMKSYYEMSKLLPSDKERLEALMTLCGYMFGEISQIDYEEFSDMQKMYFKSCEPHLIKNTTQYLNNYVIQEETTINPCNSQSKPTLDPINTQIKPRLKMGDIWPSDGEQEEYKNIGNKKIRNIYLYENDDFYEVASELKKGISNE